MVASSATVKLGVDGASELKKQLKEITQQSKTLAAEMQAAATAFDDEADAEQKNAKVKEALAKQIDAQQQKIDLLKSAVEKYTAAEGDSGNNTLKYREQLAKAETEMNKMKGAASELEGGVKDVGNEMEDAGNKSLSFSDILKANVISEAIIGGVKALAEAFKAVAGAVKDTIVDSAAFADDILTMSTTTGVATDTLQEWQYMQQLTDVSIDTMTSSLTKLTRNMNSARDGTGDVAETFASLGVNITDSNGALRDNEDVFFDTLDALGKITNETERDAAAMTLFGKSAQDLNPIIELGSEGMQNFANEAHEMGYVLDEDALGSLGGMDDAMQRLSNTSTTLKNKLGVALAPTINSLADDFMHFAQEIDWNAGLDGIVTGIMNALPGMITKLLDAVNSIVTSMTPMLPDLVALLISVIVENLPAMSNSAVDIVVALINGIADAMPVLIRNAPIIVLTLANAIINGAAEIAKTGIVLVIELIDGIQSMASNIWNALKSFVNENILRPIGDAINNVWQIGENLVIGIWNGIVSNLQWIKNQLTSWVGNVLDFIKNLFGIHSPSTVTEGYGQFLVKGLANGISDNIGIAEKAWGKLDTAIAAPTVNAGGGAISVNVYGTAGQNVNELADIVAYKLQSAVNRREAVFA